MPAPATRSTWIAVDPAGARVAVSFIDGVVRQFEPDQPAEVAPPISAGAILGYTSDGAHLVSIGDGDVGVWAAASGLLAAVVDRSRWRAPTLDLLGVAHLWDLPDDHRPVEDWVAIAELYSLRHVEPDRTDTVSGDEALALWTRLAATYPAEFRPSPEE